MSEELKNTEHQHVDSCGCGHDHEHEHDHEHHHENDHDHDHDHHDHENECGCGHNHEHDENHEEIIFDESIENRIYILEGIDCANCAAKIENRLKQMPEIQQVSITFATKQLRVAANNQDELMPKMQEIINSMEDGITIIPKEELKAVEKEKKANEGVNDEKKSLIAIIIGAILFVAGLLMEHFIEVPMPVMLGILIIAYLILGGKVLLTAAKNISKGQIFDENFLMCIATLGAFAIQEFPEAVGVMLFYRIGAFFEDRAISQSRKQIMDAVDLRPEVVNLIEGDSVRVIDAEEANVGDLVLVRPGDRIPLDGVIVDGESRIDTSPVTGEAVPVRATVGDAVTSGCVNTSGQLKVKVEKVLEESMVTRILDSVENAAANKPNIDKFITKFARVYTPLVVLAAIIVAVVLPFIIPNWHFFVDANYVGEVGFLYGTEGTASILTALTFLVISCPCALVLSVPLAFFSGIGAASKKGILFKGGSVIESLSAIKAVVMDKTGTITKGNFVVQEVISVKNEISNDELLSYLASCEMASTHPIAVSIVTAAEEKNISFERPSNVEEIAGHGIKAVTSKGSFLCGNRKLMDANSVDMSAYNNNTFGTEVLIAINGEFAGYVVISDTIKEDAIPAIAKAKQLGIITAMLTGDAQDSAENVAKITGIDEVHAKLLPEDKLNELMKIREAHGQVMFVGDGINDAPVLAGADVGAAMGSGADAAIEAADLVFMNSEVEAIPAAIDIAKATKRISWQNVYFALIIKFIVMVLGLVGFANMWLAVLADTGVSMLCLLNSFRILKRK